MPLYPPLKKESADCVRKNTKFPYLTGVKLILPAILSLSTIQGLAAQNAESTASSYEDLDHPERKVVTYLDIDHAVRNIDSLKSQVMTDIVRLNRIIKNFNGKVEGADSEYKKIREGYQKGIDLYYRREYLNSSYALKDTRKMSLGLYKKFADHFQTQVSGLLNSCSESMVNHELKNLPGESRAQISMDEIRQNQYKLKIAYYQVYLADQMTRDNRHDTAIDHLRLAKLYAINVLKNMETDEAKKSAMDKQYETDIIDAMGGVVGDAPSGNPT